ncbi:hypothetical protein PybrP1_002652 [[Pythium] brassicae (nom. inval.)]|nr:hypothetical protein PybrP1_002652 [[Pythium] brassicae (nom. inval.)]
MAIVHGNNIKDTRMARVMTIETDELPAAVVAIRGREFGMKLDTRATCSIAGSDMRKCGVKLDVRLTMDKMYRLGDAAFNVEGVWRFAATAQYHQWLQWDALVAQGIQHEFIMGKDVFEQKRA